MAISSNNIQVYTTLSKQLVAEEALYVIRGKFRKLPIT